MNQYHCETCKHMQVTDKGMSPDCEKTKHWLTEGDRKLTKEVGCASHSDFQSERDKVLDKIVERLNDPWFKEKGGLKGLYELTEELRQSKE